MSTIRRRSTVVIAMLISIGLILLAINAVGFPTTRSVKAAIVNLDEPVKLNDQTVPMGRQLAAELVDQNSIFDWEITTAELAEKGLADGTYTAQVVIPQDFSASATSMSSPKQATQAQVNVQVRPGATDEESLAVSEVTAAASTTLGHQLSENFVSSTMSGLDSMQSQLTLAGDGASKLADGSKELSEGTSALAQGTKQLADGVASASGQFAELNSGIGQLNTGANDLVDGLKQTSTGTQDLASAIRKISGGASDFAAGVTAGAASFPELSTGVKAGFSAVSSMIGTAGKSAETTMKTIGTMQYKVDGGNDFPGLLASATTLSTDLTSYAQMIGMFCSAEGIGTEVCTDENINAINLIAGNSQAVTYQTQGISTDLGTTMEQATQGITDIYYAQGATDTINAEDGDLSMGLKETQAGFDQMADASHQLAGVLAQIADGAETLALGTQQTSVGAGQLAAGLNQVSSGVSEASSGISTMSTKVQEMATGTEKLADGASQLADGNRDLAKGLDTAATSIPSYTDAEISNLATSVAAPITTTAIGEEANTQGTIAMLMLLWLATFILTIVFAPFVPNVVGSTKPAWTLAFAAWWRPAAWSTMIGLIAGLILANWAVVDFAQAIAIAMTSMLAGIVFLTVQQALTSAFGLIGRILSLAILALAAISSLTTIGLSTLGTITGLLPIGQARIAINNLIITEITGGQGALVGLLIWGVLAFIVIIWATGQRRSKSATAVLQLQMN